MSTSAEEQPLSVGRESIPFVPSILVGSGDNVDTSVISDVGDPTRQVVKRPFLRRGSRMPISKIPADPLEPVVQPIKNPPRGSRADDSVVGARDLDRPGSHVATPVKQPRAAPAKKSTTEHSDSDRFQAGLRVSGTKKPVTDRWSPSFMEREETPPLSVSKTSVRRQKAPAPVDSRSARVSVDSVIYGQSISARSASKPATSQGSTSVSEEGLLERVRELDAQIEKFKKENEQCKRLRLERETALAEANRYKERALRELEAAEKEIEEQKNSILNEKRKVQTDKDRGRSIAAQLRDFTDENRSLREKIEQMDSENSAKTKKLKNEVARLNSLLSDMARVKYDLELEVKSLTAQLSTKTPEPFSDKKNTSKFINNSVENSARKSPVVGELIREDPNVKDDLISEFTHPDGRVDRSFPDGKREAVFPSGLRKTVWPDGSALVHFPNGDVKETSVEGVVVYRYYSTGCVQTTHPDGTEVLEFTSGQSETHFPDGSKEIVFPNKLVKRIPASN